jgi:diguanylate cyclase (GGDEF)-like protein
MDDVHVIHFGHPDHIRAFLAVPMTLGDKVVGMLSAQSYHPYKYTELEQQMLEMLAAHAAIAIDNSKLFAQVQHLAITDSLTDIFNRRYFFDSAQREFTRSLRYGHKLSIMMLDLDNFKNINDLYGHLVGDNALIEFSRLILNNIRETDILCRYGGDEFSILLPETTTEEAMDISDRLRILIRESQISANGNIFNSTISVGISTTNESVTDFSQLMLCADKALYEAKKGGRDQVYYCEWPLKI